MTTSYTECCRTTTVNVEYQTPILFGANKGQIITLGRRECASCHTASPSMVHITTRNARGGRKTECGAACLNGKITCDCKCNGRCHGASKCQCEGAVA